MSGHHRNNQEFIDSLEDFILVNIGNQDFGAKGLADAAGMSPRKLSQKLRSVKGISVSRFICETRLKKALELLQTEDLTASEAGYKVGFGSPTYFNKCFHEFFGYPPGKIRKEDSDNTGKLNTIRKRQEFFAGKSLIQKVISAIGGLITLAGLFFIVNYLFVKKSVVDGSDVNSISRERSLAVLPFKNLSDSAADQYFIDGVMDEILINLSRIHDLRVVSRSSVAQFRESKMSTSEIGKKLNVDFLVTASCQKYGNTFRLRVQLIDALKDRQIWAKSYDKEISKPRDIFNIQSDVAQSVASELKATITPEEKQTIEKVPTTNLTAYDLYQRGNTEFLKYFFPYFDKESVRRAEMLFLSALECDSTFALPYVGLAFVLWRRWDQDNALLLNGKSNNYLDSMLVLANKALTLDYQIAEAYLVRGEYYSVRGSVEKALEEWNKAIKYNPNEGIAYTMIGGMYEELDIVKSLEYLQKAAFLNHGRDLVQTLKTIGSDYYKAGFPDQGNYFLLEALKLDGDSDKYFNIKVRCIASTLGDYKRAVEHFENSYSSNPANEEVLLLLGYYNSLLGYDEESLKYYKIYLSVINDSDEYNTRSTRFSRIGYAYYKCGFRKEADYYLKRQIELCKARLASVRPGEKIYFLYPLAGAYICIGEKEKAYESLRMFDRADSFTKEWVTLLKRDPQFNSIRAEPEFQKILKDVESKYKAEHERVGRWLETQGKN
jgi:TolB-like protein/AraC-like DNA-binding protein/Tfp pilus assembly protein PilF